MAPYDLTEITPAEIEEIDPKKYRIFPRAAIITVDGIQGNRGDRWQEIWKLSPEGANFCMEGGRRTVREGDKASEGGRYNVTDVAIAYGVMDKETLDTIIAARPPPDEE